MQARTYTLLLLAVGLLSACIGITFVDTDDPTDEVWSALNDQGWRFTVVCLSVMEDFDERPEWLTAVRVPVVGDSGPAYFLRNLRERQPDHGVLLVLGAQPTCSRLNAEPPLVVAIGDRHLVVYPEFRGVVISSGGAGRNDYYSVCAGGDGFPCEIRYEPGLISVRGGAPTLCMDWGLPPTEQTNVYLPGSRESRWLFSAGDVFVRLVRSRKSRCEADATSAGMVVQQVHDATIVGPPVDTKTTDDLPRSCRDDVVFEAVGERGELVEY